MTRKIEVVDHCTNWKELFDREATNLVCVFGIELIAIHHIGSTAIPGIKAKPVIDILIEIKDIKKIEYFNEKIILLGYRPRGECLNATVPGIPGRFYFSKDTDGIRSHQLHVCEGGHYDIQDKLNFRDYMRSHSTDALQYSELKNKLAQNSHDDNIEYMRGKDEYIKAVILKAKCWKESLTKHCT